MMKIGKPFWALMHPTENWIVWEYEEPITANTRRSLLERLEIKKKYGKSDLLADGYVIRKVILSYAEK